MLLIGLTGPSGSGKSAVSDIFEAHGIPVISADEVYHRLLIPPSDCLDHLVTCFGAEILLPDGSLDRTALGNIVFNDPDALERLNTVSHRYVMAEIRKQTERLRRTGIPAAVMDAPQLFEAGADRDCGVIVSVLADRDLRLDRIMRRDRIDAEAALRRMNAQKSDEFYHSHSDYIIENDGSMDRLYPQVHRILIETGVLSS